MSANIKTFNPACQVTLYKTVTRKTVDGQVAASQRFIGAQPMIDLTPFLSDQGAIRTMKSVRAPAGGFSLTLTDRMSPTDFDSIYGLIEPMDLIEIRMTRNGYAAASSTVDGKLPLIMRGFVTRAARAERMSEDGHPSRQIVITGQDYGKLWQIYQIFYAYTYPVAAYLITAFKFFAKYGKGFQNQLSADFVKSTISNILNPFIDGIRAHSTVATSPILDVTVAAADVTVTTGMVAPFGLNQWEGGTLYQLLATFGDVGPWNELFLEDRQQSVNLVYRPNPYFNANGQAINSSADAVDVVSVDISECTEISLERSDSDVSNYYWVEAGRSSLIYGPTLQILSAYSAQMGTSNPFYVQDHGNCDPTLYGLRKMTTSTQQGDPAEIGSGAGLQATDHYNSLSDAALWITQRRDKLQQQNWDNVVFESGTMTIRGNEKIRAGTYIELTRGTLVSRYYVVEASHSYTPFGRFLTSVTVERGTGFIERIQRGGGRESPWLSELATKQ